MQYIIDNGEKKNSLKKHGITYTVWILR